MGLLTDGDFDQGADGLTGWFTSDPQYVTVNSTNQAIIAESRSDLEVDLYQDFVLPQGAKSLSFTLDGFTFDNSVPSGTTPDAFGVSLLDPTTDSPLVASVDAQTDSYFIEDVVPGAPSEETAGVTVTPGTAPGSERITLDVSSLQGQPALLVFRFIGGSDISQLNGSATISEVTVFVNAPPVAVNDSAQTQSDKAVTIDVLGNDFDPDGSRRSGHALRLCPRRQAAAPSSTRTARSPTRPALRSATTPSPTRSRTTSAPYPTPPRSPSSSTRLPWPSTTRPRPSRTRR